MERLPRILILVVAYNAESTVESVMSRIPKELSQQFDLELLVLDDCSGDATFVRSLETSRGADWALPTTVLRNPTNRGYGGNQKIGMEYAIEMGFDFLVLLHGDGQYAPERLPDMLAPLVSGEAEAVMGSRMLTKGGARRGGMPLYKLLGNRVLTTFQNKLLGTDMSEFHSGYRAVFGKCSGGATVQAQYGRFSFRHADPGPVFSERPAGCRSRNPHVLRGRDQLCQWPQIRP